MRSLSRSTSKITRQNRRSTLIVALLVSGAFAGCRRSEAPAPAVATPSATLSRAKVPLGAPMDVTYRFVVAPDAPAFAENYRAFVHVVDTDEKLHVDRQSRSADADDGMEALDRRSNTSGPCSSPFVRTSAAPRSLSACPRRRRSSVCRCRGRTPVSAPTTSPAWRFCRRVKRCSPS